MPDRTDLRGWSSSALRRLFDEHRDDYSILNRLNEALKQRYNDSDNDLHVEVVMALRAAQRNVNERACSSSGRVGKNSRSSWPDCRWATLVSVSRY